MLWRGEALGARAEGLGNHCSVAVHVEVLSLTSAGEASVGFPLLLFLCLSDKGQEIFKNKLVHSTFSLETINLGESQNVIQVMVMMATWDLSFA